MLLSICKENLFHGVWKGTHKKTKIRKLKMTTNSTDMETPVLFKIGEENKPVIYGMWDYNKSIFKPQLDFFFSHVRRKMGQDDAGSDIFNDVYDNNIFAFIGERGAGKTSCMYSAINIMRDAQTEDDWNLIYGENRPKKKLKFIKTIDPSCFDRQHNILEMLVGEMYRETMRWAEDESRRQNRDAFHLLIEQFQLTKRHLRFLSTDKSVSHEDDELEELAYLSSGVDLRESMKTLVDRFLAYMGGDMLVVGVDDIDLNTSQAFSMVEQIRKYLILPQVMILMAVKLEQLDSVIRLELAKEFKEIMRDGQSAMSDADLSEMVERYLNKLIPLQARIYLPKPTSIYNRKLIVQGTDGAQMEFDSVREAVPALIFAKCRYLFYNTKGETSLIVPRNLRDLRMLIRMLFMMDDYDKAKENGISKENKQQFRHYFFGSWLDDMSARYKAIAHELINETEPTLLNKKVLEQMKLVGKFDDVFFDQFPVLSDILNPSNKAYNISVGDTLYVLNQLENMETSAELRKLIFFIKSLFSIRLYEYYNEYPNRQTVDNSSTKPYRGQSLENVSDYEKLIGGSLFLLEGDTLLPKENGNIERELRNINGGKLMAQLSDVVKMYDAESDKSVLFANQEFLNKLRVVEFFMLTISRYIWTSDKSLTERGIHKYRLQPKAYYDRAFDVGTKSLLFDIFAPFFTLIDVEHSYNRFHDRIFKMASDCQSSLYNELKQKPQGDGRSFLSRSCIRNAEIIDDLFIKMQMRRGNYRESDNAKIMKAFYRNLASYKIYTYDKKQVGAGSSDMDSEVSMEPYYKITFPEFEVFSRQFDDEGSVEGFNAIYNSGVTLLLLRHIELVFRNIWKSAKSMKGSSIIENIRKHYPSLYEMMGKDDLDALFDCDKTYQRKAIIQTIASAVEQNPVLALAVQDNAKKSELEEKQAVNTQGAVPQPTEDEMEAFKGE